MLRCTYIVLIQNDEDNIPDLVNSLKKLMGIFGRNIFLLMMELCHKPFMWESSISEDTWNFSYSDVTKMKPIGQTSFSHLSSSPVALFCGRRDDSLHLCRSTLCVPEPT